MGDRRTRQEASAGWARVDRRLLASLLLLAVILPAPAAAQDLILPEWEYEAAEQDSGFRRGVGKTADYSWSFINDTVSDTWSITKAPIHWRWKGWLSVAALAGVTTGMIYTVDSDVRRASLSSEGFEEFGEIIRYLGNGPGLIALTGGFALAGIAFDRPKERETARLLLEASASGYLFTVAGKYTFGRSRPSSDRGPKRFRPFSGNVSLPSGEATSAFIMAGVVTSQYPAWPVQLTAYSLAAAVGAGRIALDAHWASDVVVSAALGIAVSKAVVHFNRKRAEKRRNAESEQAKRQRHFVQISPRAFRWTYVW